jgi:hypothetical protein
LTGTYLPISLVKNPFMLTKAPTPFILSLYHQKQNTGGKNHGSKIQKKAGLKQRDSGQFG